MAQPTLTPREFAHKWGDNETKEKAAAQEHFIDLCRMLGEPTPNEADPTGEHYAFEKAVTKQTGLMKRIARYDFPKSLGTISGFGLMDPSAVEPADIDDSMARTSAGPQIQEEIHAIRAVPSTGVPAFNADLDEAESHRE